MEPTKQKEGRSYYVPTLRQSADRQRVYKHVEEMRLLKDKKMPHFSGPEGERSWKDYIDDSEKIINGYVLSREMQGKEEWMSNLLDNISRAKLRAVAAGVGLKVPEMSFEAVDKNGMRSSVRADIFKNITRQSYYDTNPTLQSFLELWTMLSHGVIFEYEGYKTGGAMQEVVESFDSLTGEVKTKKQYRKMDGKPYCVLINPQEFYFHTFFVRDIQDQPRIAWVQHYTRREIELEFSKFPNYKYIMSKSEVARFAPIQDTLYFSKWSERVQNDDDYEVIRYYSKSDEGGEDIHGNKTYGYETWINGVPMLQCPLLWGDKEKVYPFAKEICEPFANTNFFVGMSFAGILEAYQDGKNTVLNTLIDKLYRNVDPLKLVGLQNRDLLDVESDVVTQDNTIYVPDISAVKFMEHPQINAGELAMLRILDSGIDSVSVDKSQQGMSSTTEKTARQAILEDARAREIKGILYVFLENLWLQKTRLRTRIILSHYIKDKAAADSIRGQIITIKDYSFGDGGRGTLDIFVAKDKNDRLSTLEIEAREQAMEAQGISYKLISIDSDYLDEWEYDFKVIPTSFHNQDKVSKEEELVAETQQMTTLFPEFFAANKDHYLKDFLEIRGKHPDEFNKPPVMPPPMNPMMPQGGGSSLPPEQVPPAGASPLDIGAMMLNQ